MTNQEDICPMKKMFELMGRYEATMAQRERDIRDDYIYDCGGCGKSWRVETL